MLFNKTYLTKCFQNNKSKIIDPPSAPTNVLIYYINYVIKKISSVKQKSFHDNEYILLPI